MAGTLLKFYEKAQAEGGLQMKMRLAIATGIPSNKAGDAPDSPDVLAKFRSAFKEITGKDAGI